MGLGPEPRVLDLGDRERRAPEIQLRLGQPHQFREGLERALHRPLSLQQPGAWWTPAVASAVRWSSSASSSVLLAARAAAV